MAYGSKSGGYNPGQSKGMAYSAQKSSMGDMKGYNVGAIKEGSAGATLSYVKGGSRDRGVNRAVSKTDGIIKF